MPEIRDATDIAGVLATLDALVAEARRGEFRWGLFASLYREVTRAVAVAVDAGTFEDADRMNRFDAAFANRYFEALRRDRAGQAPAKAWQVALDASERAELIALQHLLLGVNAHINLDLGLAVVEAGIDPVAFRADFVAINRILADVLGRAQAALGAVSPSMDALDRMLGRADEALGLFVIERARDQAWIVARLVDALAPPLREPLEQTIDRATAQLGRRIADPGRPASAAISLIRHREAWTVRAVLDRFDGVHAEGEPPPVR